MEPETLEVDVLVVGAGPAGLSFAIHLARLAQERGEELAILVLDKAEELGRHQLSGAVMDPRGILALFPHARSEGFPVQSEVTDDAFLWLTEKGHRTFRGAFLPPNFRNEGKWIVSAQEMVVWLAEKAEAAGVEVYPGFAGAHLVWDGERLAGVRTADQGRGKDGEPKANFQPGMEIRARLTVLAEGPRGSLTKDLSEARGIWNGRNPQIYGVGVKELWEVERDDLVGKVLHTGGWPLGKRAYGGGWIYGLPDRKLSIGFVTGMDHGDPSFDYHALMQLWKTHPFLRELLEGGKMLRYGAKTVPEGGYWSLPKCWGDGWLVLGDSAGFLDAARLKGLHLAIESGMIGAEAAVEALAGGEGLSVEKLSRFDDLFDASKAREQLWKVRNFRQGFQKGFYRGMLGAGLTILTGGRLPAGRVPAKADHELYRKGLGREPWPRFQPDGKLTFDKLTDVYHSGTVHEEDQPCHLHVLETSICVDRCTEEYGNPCRHFCPAAVYEWEGGPGPKINASNCVHCKTCDVADPYQNIDWQVPESGGPVYLGM